MAGAILCCPDKAPPVPGAAARGFQGAMGPPVALGRPGAGAQPLPLRRRQVVVEDALLEPSDVQHRNISYRQLAERLEALGVHDSERNINNKISRGEFTAVFFVQCLVAIGCRALRLEDG